MNAPSELAFTIRDHLMTRMPAALRTADQNTLLAIISEAIAAHVPAEDEPPIGHDMIEEAKDAKQIPPSLARVTAMLKKIESDLDPVDFIEFYAAKGWMVGKTRMRDWHSALRRADRLWERRPKHEAGGFAAGKPLSEWERKAKDDRARVLRERLRELTHPGGSAYSVELVGEKRAQAQLLIDKLAELRRELAS